MLKELITEYLLTIDQPHLLAGLETLSPSELDVFWHQLQHYPATLLQKQRVALRERRGSHEKKGSHEKLEPLLEGKRAGSAEDRQSGRQLIAEGKVACLLLAGGQGTRLNMPSHVPKGLFHVTAFKKKTLFQVFFERVKAASQQAHRPLSVAVMTSPLNHASTAAYLKKERYFGLEEKQVDLFSQNLLPLLGDEGNWVLSRPGELAVGPDGNGGCFKLLNQTGIAEKWRKAGVEYVNVVLVDNVLADPFDAEFVGFQARRGLEIAVKGIKRTDPNESIGIFARHHNHLKVVEYSEADAATRSIARFPLANISLFSLSLPFINKLKTVELPWHLASKNNLWKFEIFLFDVLDLTTSADVLVYPKERCFAPLKRLEGEASPAVVEECLQQADREAFFHVSGVYPPKGKKFELDPAFYYPTADLLKRWQGRELPGQDYIAP